MKVKYRLSLVVLSLFSFLLCHSQTQNNIVRERECASINFRFAKSMVDSGYMNNRSELARLKALLLYIARDSSCVIDSIVLSVKNAPDGDYNNNIVLAKRRATSLKGYLYWRYPQLLKERFITHTMAEDWDGLRAMIANDARVPSRVEALGIIDFTTDVEIREELLRKLNNGAKFDSGVKHYWGITRLGINLVYRFNIKK